MAASLRATALKSPSGRLALSSSFSSSSSSSSSTRRHLSNFSPAKAQVQPTLPPLSASSSSPPPPPNHELAPNPASRKLSSTYFDTSGTLWMSQTGEPPPDPNKANLGKTLRILQERLPTLLQSPLPQSILAPGISLQLFPSTHPHLPTVSGRVAYMAALWTSPIAWNRVPLIGNVRLEILAERMTSEPLTFLPRRPGAIPEQLVVRWCEARKGEEGGNDTHNGSGSNSSSSSSISLARRLTTRRGVDPGKAFTGLFIFDFDREGRILTHTIEQAQEGGNWEKGVGAKFVGLTDWLLGGMRNPDETPIPMFARKRRPEF